MQITLVRASCIIFVKFILFLKNLSTDKMESPNLRSRAKIKDPRKNCNPRKSPRKIPATTRFSISYYSQGPKLIRQRLSSNIIIHDIATIFPVDTVFFVFTAFYYSSRVGGRNLTLTNSQVIFSDFQSSTQVIPGLDLLRD